MSVNINSITPLATVPVQVQTAINANNVTNLANATKTVVLDASNALGYISRPKAYGEIYVTGNTTATSIATAGTFVQFTSSNWLSNALNSQFVLNSTTGIQYTGSASGNFYVIFNVSATTSVNNQVCSFLIYKNGAPLANCRSSNSLSNALPQNAVLSGIVNLANSDILSLYLTNFTNTNAITLQDVSFEVIAI